MKLIIWLMPVSLPKALSRTVLFVFLSVMVYIPCRKKFISAFSISHILLESKELNFITSSPSLM